MVATPPSTQDEGESPSQRPKKRRRITKDADEVKRDSPQQGQQQHLDLSSDEIDGDDQEQLDRLMKVLHKRRKIGGFIVTRIRGCGVCGC
jgi:NAD-dependent histone deacetylase SIR2